MTGLGKRPLSRPSGTLSHKGRGEALLTPLPLDDRPAGFAQRSDFGVIHVNSDVRRRSESRTPDRLSQYPPKLPAAPGNTTGLSVPSFATAATPKK